LIISLGIQRTCVCRWHTNGRIYKFKESTSLFCKRTGSISFFKKRGHALRLCYIWNKIIPFNESDDLFCTV